MPHPIQLVVTDDLKRNRLTVFFRLILAIPHFIVLYLWGIVANIAVVIAWFAALITGGVPAGLHNFIASYLRYAAHVNAYMSILADPYPPFSGSAPYPVDLEIAPTEPQSRVTVFFRIILAIPALIVTYALNILHAVIVLLGWFASLILGRMPKGLRDTGAWTLRVTLQAQAYVMLLTGSYPQFGPTPEPDAQVGAM
jgi:Domain of unknown function (DUF4389)